jgi:gliding motility-associated-like protein
MFFSKKFLLVICLLTTTTFIFAQQTSFEDVLEMDSINFLNSSPGTHIASQRSAKNNIAFPNTTMANKSLQYYPKNKINTGASKTTSTCMDTSGIFYLQNDSLYLYTFDPIATHDGNYLISGQIAKNFGQWSGYLMKFNRNGIPLWIKTYNSSLLNPNDYFYYFKVLELQNGEIVVIGATNNSISPDDDLVITKLSATGSVIWSKIYNSRLWPNGTGGANRFYLPQIREDTLNGDIYFCGSLDGSGSMLVKLNSINGSIIWAKSYLTGGYLDRPFGFAVKTNTIQLISRCLDASGGPNIVKLSLFNINKNNGDTISTKCIAHSDLTNGIMESILFTSPLQIANNGNYLLGGNCFGYSDPNWSGNTPLTHAAMLEVDTNFNFKKAFCFKNYTPSATYATRLSIYPDGSGLLSMLDLFSNYTGRRFYTQFANGQISNKRIKLYTEYEWETHSLQLPGGGDFIVKSVIDSVNLWARTALITLHATDTPSVCLGLPDQQTYIENNTYAPIAFSYDSVRTNVFQESVNKPLVAGDFIMNKVSGCATISYCDSLKLTPASTTICLSQTLQIKTKKNAACGSTILWQYSNAVVSNTAQVNDSIHTFQFSAPWSGYIYASIPGCAIIKDSVFVNVLQAPAQLNIGPDTVICTGNTILLNAHSGYASYLWQNSSTDSTFIVTTPGVYYVKTTNACGGVFTDTVIVSLHPPISFTAGPDRSKCNADTIHLHATAGFINYNWSPNYNISSTIAQNVIVNPFLTTNYFVKAEKMSGCFVYDTVKVTVYTSPLINLGEDTSLCSGQSITLSAGILFNSYLWSTNSTAPSILISQPGIYWLKATDNNGCTVNDSIAVNPKQCLKGLFVPTAFTPNKDNLNDLLKIYLFGDVVKYQFKIFNRFGQVVFESTDINKVWDGSFNGRNQSSGTFVWYCNYQLNGENPKNEKGTIMLIR